MILTDAHGRKHDYLRISVTDRCNLRCLYCMGEEGVPSLKHEQILAYEEIMRVVSAGEELGLTKIRITGGEPLVRRNVAELVAMISALPGITDLSMTTNGILLPRYAAALRQAGLQRVNISLDSLRAERYAAITRGGKLELALAGIEAAQREKLLPIKLNTVLMKKFNDDEVGDFLRLAMEKDLHVRFIEYMPIGNHDHAYREHYLPLDHVLEEARRAGLSLKRQVLYAGAGPAEVYSLPGERGSVGLIHPVSKHFCGGCNRLRLTADGKLKACLYWQDEHSVRPVLHNKLALQELLRRVLLEKPAEHLMASGRNCGAVNPATMRAMSRTGG